jgi:Putative regulator of cell autolysis
MIISHFLMEMIPPDKPMRSGPPGRRNILIAFMLFDFVKYLFVAALSVALKMTSEWYKTENKRKELEKMHSDAELQNLKSQLNPHFLFNTLNNIYSLIAINSEQAQDSVHVLSKLLRYILYDSSQPLVPIEKDIDFVHNYIELMRIRLPNHAELKTDIQVSSLGVLIAPLLFISLIENAFKHGISNNKPSFIDICIVSDNEHIKCSIRNSFFPKNEADDSGSGIGIANLRRRLDLLYPDSNHFVCERDGDTFISELTITL